MGVKEVTELEKLSNSDGSKIIELTIWSDLIEIIKENQLIQIFLASFKIFNEEIIITINYSTSICFLADDAENDLKDIPINEATAQ